MSNGKMKWFIDTEYAHGIDGLLSVGFDEGKIGSDLEFMGSIKGFFNSIKSGSVAKYLKRNDYQPVDEIELALGVLDSLDREKFRKLAKKNGIKIIDTSY